MVDDELYALAPEEFVPARDALAKRLKGEGDTEAAAAVRALRRPSLVAWAINRAVREHPDAVRDLLLAGDHLRRAQEHVVSGRADAATLREASEQERTAVASLVAAVAEAGQSSRRPLSPSMLDRARETLHAVALDEGVRAAVEAGRLTREASAAGAGGLLAGAVAGRGASRPRTPAAREKARAADAARAAADARVAAAQAAVDAVQARVEAAEAAALAARTELEGAQRALREAKAASAAQQ